MFCAAPQNPDETLGKDCKAYARWAFAVAEARDNLDEPSIEELKKLYPIIKELEDTQSRGWFYISWIQILGSLTKMQHQRR